MKEENIISAEEFMLTHLESMDQREVASCMAEFARQCVSTALFVAGECARHTADSEIPLFKTCKIDKQSIYNSFPISNIIA